MAKNWEIIKDILESFNNNASGWSARKLAAFTAVVAAALPVTWKYTNSTNLPDVLYAWLVFALLCLGIITLEQVIKFKSSIRNPNIPDKETTTTVEDPGKVTVNEKSKSSTNTDQQIG